MTTSVVKIDRTSGSIGRSTVAPAPSGGVYFAEGSNSTGIAHISRIDSAGSVVWTKEITISDATAANGITPNIHSSSDHLAVVLRYFETTGAVYKTAVVLYQSDGTLVWQKTVPVAISRQAALNDSTGFGVGGLALAEDESVYMTGTVSSNTKLALAKLNGSDGSLAWVVDLYPSSGALTGDWPAEIELLSGGDPVVTFFGYDIGGLGEEYTHVQRITASTGAAAWTRSVFWGFGAATGAAVGVDPSDNIYLSFPVNSGNNVGVVKLDSSGNTLWNRAIATSVGTLKGAMRLSATSAGVYIGHNTTGGVHGHYFVDTSGTTGAGVVKLARYTPPGTLTFEVHGSRAAGSQVLMVLNDTVSTVVRAAVILSDSTGATDDSTYGGLYARVSSTLTLNTGTATIASPTYTRASAPSLTLSSASITESSGGLTVTPMAGTTICTATGAASALAFGLPVLQGLELPYTISTVFGTTSHGRGQYATGSALTGAFGSPVANISYGATGLLNTNLFGLPVYEPDRTVSVTGRASTLEFGETNSIRGVAPYPIGRASSLDPTTTFGTAVAGAVLHGAATGFSTTTFGTTTHNRGLPASALASTVAFGTPNGPVHAVAQGLFSTAFGSTRVACLGYPSARNSTLAFGTPVLSNIYLCAASGWSGTLFGSPSTQWPTRTRSAKFRTQFGQAQTERTAP